jgi:hypothetical protein
MAKKNEAQARVKVLWTQTETTLTATFPDGAIHTWDFGGLPDDMKLALTGYGLKQKLADSTAVGKDVRLTVEERVALMQETFGNLEKNVWGKKGGGRKRDFEVLAKAEVWNKDKLAALHAVKDIAGMADAAKMWAAIPEDVRKKFGYED